MSNIVKAGNNLPALPSTPALDIGADDIALPKLKIAHYSSDFVQNEEAKAGDIVAQSGDDIQVLLDVKDQGEGLLFHVLDMTKGKSVTIDGELFTFAFNDPSAPQDAWVTYNYVLCLPEVDEDVPYKMLFTRSKRPAAQQINTVLARNSARGPAYATAFRITTMLRENPKGKYFVPRVRAVDAAASHIETAAHLAVMVAGAAPEQSSATAGGADEPAI